MVRQRASEACSMTSTKSVSGKGHTGIMNRHSRPVGGGGSPFVVPKGGFDGPISAPWRKTVSIFKQPVTLVHTTSRDTKQAPVDELRKSAQPIRADGKPRQMFWSKQLENLHAMIPLKSSNAENHEQMDYIPDSLILPNRLEPVVSVASQTATTASLISALNIPGQHPVVGQNTGRKQLDANAAVFVNPEQPLIQVAIVNDSDIVAQERRVFDARRRLEEARKYST